MSSGSDAETWVEYRPVEDGIMYPASTRVTISWINGRKVYRYWVKVQRG